VAAKRLGPLVVFVDHRWKVGATLFGFAVFLFPIGVSLSIPWRGQWWRFSALVRRDYDDGCLKLNAEVAYWLSRTMQGVYTRSQGKGVSRSYVQNSKRYFRVMTRVRYRARLVWKPTEDFTGWRRPRYRKANP
jgi:hypothetical protein